MEYWLVDKRNNIIASGTALVDLIMARYYYESYFRPSTVFIVESGTGKPISDQLIREAMESIVEKVEVI